MVCLGTTTPASWRTHSCSSRWSLLRRLTGVRWVSAGSHPPGRGVQGDSRCAEVHLASQFAVPVEQIGVRRHELHGDARGALVGLAKPQVNDEEEDYDG